MLSPESILSARLKISLNANHIIQVINEIKELDPVMAGAMHEEVNKYIKDNTQTSTVFSIRELEEYGYLNKVN